MFQDKAQTAKNGLVLLKGCNTVLGHLGSSLRASREAVVRGVTPLGKDQPLRGGRFRLVFMFNILSSVFVGGRKRT